MSSNTVKCSCKCSEKYEPKRECECKPKRECECKPKRECEYKPKCECEKKEYECERDHGKDFEWFEKALKEAYWRGFKDGCRKCRRKENECDECEKYDEYEEYEEYEDYDEYEK